MHMDAESETGSQEVVGSSPIASTAKAQVRGLSLPVDCHRDTP